ncbi:DUF779 domain-containing protein [Gordonia sp. (in: high G+C Gram-positive bacteria)]|uniref:DUF779 domain-containing protein n=2 Tax=Gordonia sp. (in: high G+C Gram-positive bacteria) TaxID=84139 RepID=UPI001D966DFE|nr:DUF779 domain-containing protein [Gordonia sp. (in: high G+C Gram-positive bacteria)]MCB1293679.1 DUF779 domain-containing protein [Gordonia sp. (in: high G+C Gram-positive bacteria)]HMS74387.1 DUF779 domain-containing protein [Gordonia sp. (in: high G+C Gram-positive bacteria)]HQV18753.1 DUF779 domain-containing protein [Gordonia sp. (in: high G+C Gram-positive bacteria)]
MSEQNVSQQDVPDRVTATDSAVQLLTKLSELHGGLMIHQSGGCCDGSAPMCYPVGEYRIGQRDVLVGEIGLPEPIPAVRVWINGDQFELWKHTQLILDVVKGRGAGFSLEAPEGVRFLSRSRAFSEQENDQLAQSPPKVGADFSG